MNKFKLGDRVNVLYPHWKNADEVGVVIGSNGGLNNIQFENGDYTFLVPDEFITPATDWVKCSERMPELYESVLVLYTDGSISDDWTIERKGQRTWNCISTEDATHWMPLPDLPTEDA